MDYKDIPSCPGYKISKEGVVIGKTGKELKVFSRTKNHFVVKTCVNKTKKNRTLHSLLAETWLIDDWKNQMEPGEEWKVIDGFEDYIITSKGKVWSKIRNRWLLLRNFDAYYWRTGLSKNGQTTPKVIHTLVGRHFLEDYKEGLQIHHHNEELPFPEINYVDNLWVGTPQENMEDKIIKDRSNQTNKHGFTGVSLNGNLYRFQLQIGEIKISESGFATALEAHEAYLAKRMELKGY